MDYITLQIGVINLTESECFILNKLIMKKIVFDKEFLNFFSQNSLRILICRLNKKMKNELIIKRKNKIGYYIKYLGGQKSEK